MGELDQYKHAEFDLGELVATATSFLEGITYRSIDGRVTAIPDVRTVRYYQSVGIMRKPLRYKGRSAVYGYLHLLQLIAVKLLQTQGLSLAQIQKAMMQLSQNDLERQLTKSLDDQDQISTEPSIGMKRLHVGPHEFASKMGQVSEDSCDSPDEALIPIYQRPPEPQTRDLIATEIVPGVTMMIDPDKVKDAKALMRTLKKMLQSYFGEDE